VAVVELLGKLLHREPTDSDGQQRVGMVTVVGVTSPLHSKPPVRGLSVSMSAIALISTVVEESDRRTCFDKGDRE
jgi:hypothetical protein